MQCKVCFCFFWHHKIFLIFFHAKSWLDFKLKRQKHLRKCVHNANEYAMTFETILGHCLFIFDIITAWSAQIWSFFWSVFSRIRTEYGQTRSSLRIQSEYGKIRTRKNSVFGHFSRSEFLSRSDDSHNFSRRFLLCKTEREGTITSEILGA